MGNKSYLEALMSNLSISDDRIWKLPTNGPAYSPTLRRRPKKKPTPQISAATSFHFHPRDRISTLPDEIIHDILARIGSPKLVWRTTFLSRRWTHLLRSYPILEFDESENYYRSSHRSSQAQERLAWAILVNFSTQQQCRELFISMARVRLISDCWGFLDWVLDLAAASSSHLKEIDIKLGNTRRHSPGYGYFLDQSSYEIPETLFSHVPRLVVLKLSDCNFDRYKDLDRGTTNPFSSFGSSLEVLHLENVRFGRCDWILNSMIAGASLLETLTLDLVEGMDRFQVRNHLNLKFVEATRVPVLSNEITGAQSLEVFRLIKSGTFELQISSTPNLKEVYIQDAWNLKAQVIKKLTAELPAPCRVTLKQDLRSSCED